MSRVPFTAAGGERSVAAAMERPITRADRARPAGALDDGERIRPRALRVRDAALRTPSGRRGRGR